MGHVFRLIGSLILARLLSPEITGLMALVTVCVVGIHMFSDLGIRAVIVQHRRGDEPDFFNTAWTIQIVRGCFLWVCAILITWPAAWFYGQPSLMVLLPVLGFTAVIDGFTSTKLYSAERHLNQKRLIVLTLTSQVIFLIITIVWAYFHRSIWALVAGNLAGPATRTLLSHLALPGENNRFRMQPEARRDVLNFGRWVSVSSLFAFLSLQADRLMFGKMIPMVLLGVYNTGAMYARLPVESLLKLGSSVGYPLFCRSYREHGNLDSVFRRVSMVILILGGA
ncbi:MAG TPA: oligosaccharide flippase family protein, partial [Planctomycetota bacterium]|nr:oligosaccharide flippase family protein [Planctomycetota bacterium]